MQISISKNAKIKEKIYSELKELIISILAPLFPFQNSDDMYIATKLLGFFVWLRINSGNDTLIKSL